MYVKSVRDIHEEMKVIPTSTVPDHSMLILDVNLSDYDMIRPFFIVTGPR